MKILGIWESITDALNVLGLTCIGFRRGWNMDCYLRRCNFCTLVNLFNSGDYWILCSRFDLLSLGQAGAYSSDSSHQHFNTLPQRTQKTEQWEQRESIWPRAIIGPVLSWLLIWLIQRHVWQCAKTLKEIIPQFSNTEATFSVPFAHVPWAIPTTLADCVQCAMSCRISDFSITVLQIEFGRV